MMSNPLTPQTVFVKTDDGMTDFNVHVWNGDEWETGKTVTEQSLYIFTKEELEKLLSEVWEGGLYKRGIEETLLKQLK